ncbi:glycosyltransferase family 2 protein [Rhodoferax lacus]|uniref:glycosyltransferase family 2 protein n=1 Tax=Rhodoferax lacus TaxID=2184758 RepID=UPI00131419DA|nr:glycosyltransferase family 2 protein [Rhodoferax lacus]
MKVTFKGQALEFEMSQTGSLAVVTAIIPCYRCTATLERAVASVAAQSLVPAELILVDDCSGDDTRLLMQAIAAKYTAGWIRTVLLDKNMGAGSARNAGWAIATQPYIAFLDSDDAWHPEKVRIQLNLMLNQPELALCGHTHQILLKDDLPDWKLQTDGGKSIARPISKWQLLIANRFVTPSVMLRRDISCRFLEGQRFMEDRMLWLNIVCSNQRVARIPVALAATYKSGFGHSGLSAQWLNMARGDFGNYRRLLNSKYISHIEFAALNLFSAIKFLRRLVIHRFFSDKSR